MSKGVGGADNGECRLRKCMGAWEVCRFVKAGIENVWEVFTFVTVGDEDICKGIQR